MIAAGPEPGGTVAPGYEGVRAAFADAVDGPGALAAVVDGALVVDLWTGAGWDGDTATLLYSGTKGVAATVMLKLVERGALDLDAPVGRYWPEFTAAGKAAITVTDLLAHAAGLPAVERSLTRSDLHRPRQIAAALAAQAPMLPPGAMTYHAVTWGWLAGELAVRATGRSLGALVREQLADPLSLDLAIGVSLHGELAERLVRPVPSTGYSLSAFEADGPDPRLIGVYRNPLVAMDSWCDPDLLEVEAPAVNGIGTARAIARLYGAIASGRLLRPETVAHAHEPARAGLDALTGRPLRFGPTGYELAGTPSVLGPAADAFGHTGAGGGSHGAWPSLRTGFSFLTADLRSQSSDRRAAMLLEALHAGAAQGVSPARPNLVVIMADQLAASFLPCYGHPVVRAPNLDRLAHAGTVFESAYCASPLCAPSRFAMLAGRRASDIAAFDNAAELPAATPTIVHLLRANGYHTVLAGKMHFVGPDQLHGFEERLTTDVYPSGFDWTPDWRLPSETRLSWYHNMSGVLGAGVHEGAMQTAYDDEVCFRAVERIRELAQRPDRQPFLLVVSFTNPHDPWEVRARHWDLYRDDEIDPPAVASIPRTQADPHSLRLREMCGLDSRPLEPAEVVRGRHGYYAALSYMDERVGEVLDALENTGLDAETVVAFTADHGEMGGERGLWFKMSFFEGSARVPLVVRGPGIARGRVDAPVSHLDVAPTMAELAGTPLGEAEFEGRSLVSALNGAGVGAGAETVVSEYLAEGVTAPAVMLRRGRHKYIRCPGDPDQLYDLHADPRELVNLAADPAHAEACAAFRAESAARWDLVELKRRVLVSQARRRVVAAALATGAHTPWDYQPYTDASRQYVRGEAAWHPRPGGPLVPGALPAEGDSEPQS